MSALVEIFNNCLYRIPDYQRGYSWDESQLRDFWQDLSYVTITEGEGSYRHFYGTLTLDPFTDDALNMHEGIRNETAWLRTSEGYRGYFIVDGQQRLTTIMILLKALVDWVTDRGVIFIGETATAEITSRYLYKIRPLDGSIHYIFGYESDDPSYQFWRYHLLGQDQVDDKNFTHTAYTRRLRDAYRFFWKNIETGYTIRQQANPADYSQKELGEIYHKIRSGLLINQDILTSVFNVGIVFETMNNRGKKLSLLELLKNRLIYLATRLNNHELRRRINEVWRLVYDYIGKDESLKLDDDEFLKIHYIAYFGYNADADQYHEGLLNDHFSPSRLNQNIKELLDKIIKYIDNLKASISLWYEYQSCTPDANRADKEDLQKWLQNIKYLGYGYFEPLMLAAMMRVKTGAQPYSEQATMELISFIKALERFRFIAFELVDTKADFRRNEGYRIALDLMHLKISITNASQLVNNWINNIKDPREEFYGMVRKLFNKDNFQGFYGWSGIKYFLYRYESSLVGDAIPEVAWQNIANKTIEHIYPQQATSDYWADRFSGYTDSRKNYFLHALGNLSLASGNTNTIYGNRSYLDESAGNKFIPGKKSLYENGSFSLRIVARNYDNWGPEQITHRTQSLLAFLLEEWNIPNTVLPTLPINFHIYREKFGLNNMA